MTTALPDQRRRRILEHLNEDGSVRVSFVAGKLGVAEETIRRDLKLLEEGGHLVRTHGGAVPSARIDAMPLHRDISFAERRSAMEAEKRAIAIEAAKLIKPNTVIALDGSTTAWELARALPKIPITVVTNSLVIVNLLASRGDVRIVCTGGRLEPTLQLFEGFLAHEALQRLNIDLAFFSCRGIDAKRGYSDPSEVSAVYKQRLIELAGKSIVLADHTKFDVRSVVNFASPGKVHTIITDNGVAPSRLKAFVAAGVACVRAKV